MVSVLAAVLEPVLEPVEPVADSVTVEVSKVAEVVGYEEEPLVVVVAVEVAEAAGVDDAYLVLGVAGVGDPLDPTVWLELSPVPETSKD
jgi:hypothetical protein